VSTNSSVGPATRKLLKNDEGAPKSPGNGGEPQGPNGGITEARIAKIDNGIRPEDAGSKGTGADKAAGKVTRPIHGGKVKGPRRGPATKMAAFLMSEEQAAALNLATYAYDAVNGTVRSNVTVYMRQALDEDQVSGDNKTVVSLVTLEFPYFTSLYYDPDVEFASASDVGYANYTIVPAVIEDAVVKTKNGALSTSVRSGTVFLGLAAIALGMML
jgi:hypothetical protein